MAQKSELMAAGLPAGAANGLGNDYDGALAAGTDSQAAAAILKVNSGLFATASAGGFLLPRSEGQAVTSFYNGSGNTQVLYPTGSETINNTTSFSVTSAKAVILIPVPLGWIANLSA